MARVSRMIGVVIECAATTVVNTENPTVTMTMRIKIDPASAASSTACCEEDRRSASARAWKRVRSSLSCAKLILTSLTMIQALAGSSRTM